MVWPNWQILSFLIDGTIISKLSENQKIFELVKLWQLKESIDYTAFEAPPLHVYTVDSRYSGSLKYGHLDIPATWLDTEC